MRDYARVSPQFWTGKTGRALRRNPDAQRLALYLLTCPSANMIGVFYAAIPTICHEVGLDADVVAALLLVLESLDFAYYDHDTEMVWVPNMAREQMDDALKPGDRRVVQVIRNLDSIRRHRFARLFWDRYAVAFSLAENPEAKGLADIFAKPIAEPKASAGTPSHGVQTDARTPSKPNTGKQEDQDHAQAQDLDQAPSLPPLGSAPDRAHARSEERADPEPALWPAGRWQSRFKLAWERAASTTEIAAYYADTGDPKACATLEAELEKLPRDVRLAAQGRASAMFAEFLGRTDPRTVARKFPFSFFVHEFGALRVSRGPAPRAPGSSIPGIRSVA